MMQMFRPLAKCLIPRKPAGSQLMYGILGLFVGGVVTNLKWTLA